MIPKPESHGLRHSVRFQDQSLVERYHLRPLYPPETFEILNGLMVDEPRTVLDIGCGTGNVARNMTKYAEHIDAVDLSQPMLESAQLMPGGDSPKIRWLQGSAEKLEVKPPYTLITAGESLHWMDWEVVLPRFARMLSPHGVLAIIHFANEPQVPWQHHYSKHIFKRYTNDSAYVPIDMIPHLEDRGLFKLLGTAKTAPVVVQQTIEDYIAAQHARSSLSLDTLTAEQAKQFHAEMVELLSPYSKDGLLTFRTVGEVHWGKPLAGNEPVSLEM